MQAPRPGESLQRPQMSYSLPAQLPDPDQHMREVYLAAQAAKAEHSNIPNQVSMLHTMISLSKTYKLCGNVFQHKAGCVCKSELHNDLC